MKQATFGSWTLRDDAQGVHLGSSGCGHCEACRDRLSAWCLQPGDFAELASLSTDCGDLERDMAGIACLSAVERAGLDQDDVLVVLLDGGLPTWVVEAARRVTGGAVLATDDLKDPDLRAALADRPTGRADAVLVRVDVASAVRAVRRGGVVCVGSLVPTLPTVTDLVQREVRVIGPGGLSDRLLTALPVAPSATA